MEPKGSQSTKSSRSKLSLKRKKDSEKSVPPQSSSSAKLPPKTEVECEAVSDLDKEKASGGQSEVNEILVGSNDTESGLGEFFFCQICQKDLTRFTITRRQQHINRCCDKVRNKEPKTLAAADAEDSKTAAEFICVLCKKTFTTENVSIILNIHSCTIFTILWYTLHDIVWCVCCT